MADPLVIDFLVRSAREFRRGGWAFTGFHWPVLAGQLAHSLEGEPFTQVFEAGASTHGPAASVPTSTTDYPSYVDTIGLRAGIDDVLLGLPHRFDRVVLDASNVDVLGRVNSSLIGPTERPTVRLPGGGGAPDVAARASELVWLSGGGDLARIQRRVEHVTAAPGPHTHVRLLTRWGSARLGHEPRLEEVADVPGSDAFVAHFSSLGVATDGVVPRPPTTEQERSRAQDLLVEAATRGYVVAKAALKPR